MLNTFYEGSRVKHLFFVLFLTVIPLSYTSVAAKLASSDYSTDTLKEQLSKLSKEFDFIACHTAYQLQAKEMEDKPSSECTLFKPLPELVKEDKEEIENLLSLYEKNNSLVINYETYVSITQHLQRYTNLLFLLKKGQSKKYREHKQYLAHRKNLIQNLLSLQALTDRLYKEYYALSVEEQQKIHFEFIRNIRQLREEQETCEEQITLLDKQLAKDTRSFWERNKKTILAFFAIPVTYFTLSHFRKRLFYKSADDNPSPTPAENTAEA